jgi:hypothetical protein
MSWEISISERSWNKCTKADVEKRILKDSKKYNYDPINMMKLLQEESPKSLIVDSVGSKSRKYFTRIRYRR